MWQQEGNVFCRSLLLPWGSFQPPWSCVLWNKWFEISLYFIFYLHNTNTKVKIQCKHQSSINETHIVPCIYHIKAIIDRLWSYSLNFLFTFVFWCTTFFFINEKFLKYLKLLWKHVFYDTNYCFINSLVRTKSQSKGQIYDNYAMLSK